MSRIRVGVSHYRTVTARSSLLASIYRAKLAVLSSIVVDISISVKISREKPKTLTHFKYTRMSSRRALLKHMRILKV